MNEPLLLTFLINGGYLLMLAALAVKDVLWLRALLLPAQLCLAVFSFLSGNAAGVFWNVVFFGILATRGIWGLPIALPQIPLYKKNRHAGFARFYFDIFEAADGRYVRSTSPVEGEVHHTRYMLFVVFKWRRTDLTSPPADFERIDDENL